MKVQAVWDDERGRSDLMDTDQDDVGDACRNEHDNRANISL